MSTTYIRNFIRLPSLLYRQAGIRPTNTKTVCHAGRISHLRPLSTTPFRPAKARVLAHRNSFAQVRFTLANVPALSFWESHVGPPLVPEGEVLPAECLEACRRYASLAIEDAPGWRQRALTPAVTTSGEHNSDDPIPLSTLYYAAVLLMRFPSEGGHLATHILHTGVTLNYAPCILTMARVGIITDKLNRPQFEPTKEALEKLASNPNREAYYRADALTLMGLFHARQGTSAGDDRALQFFRDAEKVARAPNATWHWRSSAALEQSRIYIRRKQPDLAREVLRVAAPKLDNAELCFEYAMLLPPDDPERMVMVQRAAISGVEGAAREMGRIESQRAAEEGLSSTERREREILADEWLGISRDKALI
ncbi:hypothetical protein F5Y06DRAFT_277993 [Hypoxylon sp. FL0890]|nr:hypothetical protein F5Y06DRAFT_277993 [Hypoxylon sp. FL0890]